MGTGLATPFTARSGAVARVEVGAAVEVGKALTQAPAPAAEEAPRAKVAFAAALLDCRLANGSRVSTAPTASGLTPN